MRTITRRAAVTLLICLLSLLRATHADEQTFQAGAAIVDVTPLKLPVLVNGGMLSRSIAEVKTPINARAIVLDQGGERIALVVVDSCMIPRPLCDEAKELAAQRTQIRPDRITISATHSHSAPSSMSCLGTNADPSYVPYLREKLAEAIALAEANLEPAEVGWGAVSAPTHTALRRWVRRADQIGIDPFGNATVRANMHAANDWDVVTGVSGPEDPELSMISFRARTGRTIAVLANYSMHYFGDQALSADYFGLFSEGLAKRIGLNAGSVQDPNRKPIVGILSHGCSGDAWRRDYSLAPADRPNPTIEQYTDELLLLAMRGFRSISYSVPNRLEMSEERLPMRYRTPSKERLEWARRTIDTLDGEEPKTREQVYAREQSILHDRQETEVVVQAICIGDVGVVTTPCETYALTGLKLKMQSPLPRTMVIELANGGDGYIPPPEQHVLGGYNTWPARSAGLEVDAEPRIVESGLQLLEKVTQSARREVKPIATARYENTLGAKPLAYWRLDDTSGPICQDATMGGRHGFYEDGVVFFVPGLAEGTGVKEASSATRAAHFAGGRMRYRLSKPAAEYSVNLWCWNGMPTGARELSGWLFSRDYPAGQSAHGERLGVKLQDGENRLCFACGDDMLVGPSPIDRWTWYQVTLIRKDADVRVYLNGNLELEGKVKGGSHSPHLFFGGSSDRRDTWEGRLDEISLFDRALSESEPRDLLGGKELVSTGTDQQ